MIFKNFSKFDKSLLGLAVTMLVLFSYLLYDDSIVANWTAKHGPPIAEISSIMNDVRHKYSSDFRWIKAKQSSLHLGDSLFTGPNSTAQVKLKDNSVVEITENSLVVFTKNGDNINLVLKSGAIKGNSSLIKDESKDIESQLKKIQQSEKTILPKPAITSHQAYQRKVIQINPDGTLAEQPLIDLNWLYSKPNSKFQIQISSDSRFSNTEIIETIDSSTYISPELKEGPHFIRIKEFDEENPNTKWSKVIQVEFAFEKPKTTNEFPAPDIIHPDMKYIIGSKAPLKLEWKKIENAASYLLELDTKGQFKDPKKIIVYENNFKIDDVEPGQYLYRVSALNSEKQMGPTSSLGRAKAVVNPVVLQDAPAQTFYARNKNDKTPPTQFDLSWSAAPLTEKYSIQISKDAEFKKTSIFETATTQISIPIEKEGFYFWRVQPLRKKNEPLSPYSSLGVMKYIYEPPLDTPNLIAPFHNLTLFFQTKRETPFWFEWKPVHLAQSYTLEVAQDQEFKNIVLSKTLTTNKYLVREQFPQGNLYWRVSAEGNGRRSQFSIARQLKIYAGRAPARER